jgi:hypothetical protein
VDIMMCEHKEILSQLFAKRNGASQHHTASKLQGLRRSLKYVSGTLHKKDAQDQQC